ncbi:MAG TPA: 30S ribosomal protein S30 [Gammaproteobacteria bacterium]|nr:30S ribosomal protein S30 [Gammaproteobacteria bacterium]
MSFPIELLFQDVDPSDAIEAKVLEKAEKLDHFSDSIMHCRVTVGASYRRHHQGNLYHVGINMKVPDKELVVSRKHDKNHGHEDVYVAIRDSFNAIRRQLEDYERRRRGRVKNHEVSPHGRVAEIHPQEGYGRIETSEGESIYFHQNSVLGDSFKRMKVGDAVHFAKEMGEKGPQASSVYLEGKHHVTG